MRAVTTLLLAALVGTAGCLAATQRPDTTATTEPVATIDLEGSFGRAEALAAGGDLAGAATLFEEVFETSGGELFEAAYNVGFLHERLGRLSEARRAYARALALRPESVEVVGAMARLLIRTEDHDEAVDFVARQCRAHETDELLLLQANLLVDASRLEEAQRVARLLLARSDRNAPALLVAARAHLAGGNSNLALWIAEQAAEAAPQSGAAHNLMGEARRARAEQTLAVELFERAVELEPTLGRARINLGAEYLEIGRTDDAIVQLLAACRLDPLSGSAHLNLGEAYRRARRWNDAVAALEQALLLEEDLADASYNLGLLFLEAPAFSGLDRPARLRRAIDALERYKRQTATDEYAVDPTVDDLLAEARAALGQTE